MLQIPYVPFVIIATLIGIVLILISVNLIQIRDGLIRVHRAVLNGLSSGFEWPSADEEEDEYPIKTDLFGNTYTEERDYVREYWFKQPIVPVKDASSTIKHVEIPVFLKNQITRLSTDNPGDANLSVSVHINKAYTWVEVEPLLNEMFKGWNALYETYVADVQGIVDRILGRNPAPSTESTRLINTGYPAETFSETMEKGSICSERVYPVPMMYPINMVISKIHTVVFGVKARIHPELHAVCVSLSPSLFWNPSIETALHTAIYEPLTTAVQKKTEDSNVISFPQADPPFVEMPQEEIVHDELFKLDYTVDVNYPNRRIYILPFTFMLYRRQLTEAVKMYSAVASVSIINRPERAIVDYEDPIPFNFAIQLHDNAYWVTHEAFIEHIIKSTLRDLSKTQPEVVTSRVTWIPDPSNEYCVDCFCHEDTYPIREDIFNALNQCEIVRMVALTRTVPDTGTATLSLHLHDKFDEVKQDLDDVVYRVINGEVEEEA